MGKIASPVKISSFDHVDLSSHSVDPLSKLHRGIAMGYFGGKGLPFFWTQFGGAAEPKKSIAGNAFKAHKLMGQVLEYFVLLHLAATAFHVIRGQNILARMGLGKP